MEVKGVKVVVVMVVTMMMFLGQAMGRFDKCYAACYFDCIIDMKHIIPYVPKKFLPCAWKCTKKCILPASDCNISCTMDSCADNIDDAEKMEGCAENCSKNSCKIKH